MWAIVRYRLWLVVLILMFSGNGNLWASPAAPVESEVLLADGSSILLLARGDEYGNWMETLDGYSVVEDQGVWYYAEKAPDGRLVSSGLALNATSRAAQPASALHLAPDPDPLAYQPAFIRKIPRPDSGGASTRSISHTQYVLTILVSYNNTAFTYSDSSFQSLMYGNNNSVKDFYLENSYGGFTIEPPAETQGTANDGIIHITRNTNHPNTGGNSSQSREEARTVVNQTNSYINYSNYDANGDGAVSADELAIVIILAGYENSYGGSASLTPRVWGHKYNFSSNLNLDGVSLSPYTMFGEAHATSSGNKHQATIGIMCHELGHLMLGLPDLYDVDGGSAGIGDWGLMASGSWNLSSGWSGSSPSHLSAWSKVATNFTLAQDVTANQSGVSIANAESNEVAKRLWIDKYKIQEYFLVENRRKTGYDAGLPSAGLLIWHVDDSQTSNADENHKWVDLEEADGVGNLDNETSQGDAGDPFPGSSNKLIFNDASNPNSKQYSGSATQIGVTGISPSSATMTADFAVGTAGTGDHLRYDGGYASGYGLSLGSKTAWAGLRTLNSTTKTTLDGVDVYVTDSSGATIDIQYFTSISGGTPSGQIHSQNGYAATSGWNRLLFNTPQSFPAGAERGIVVKIVNNSYNYALPFNPLNPDSGRSYYDSNGSGTFSPMCNSVCGDVNIVALLSGPAAPAAPAATVITPANTGPTNTGSMSFSITFSQSVVNFNNASDLIITHSGTAHSGVNISGSGSSYTANVTGISGNGSFTLAVNTGSDVQNGSATPLASSVTSAAVNIDNTAPNISIDSPSVALTNSGPVSFTIAYTGANSISLANGNVTLNKTGTANGNVNVSGSGTSSRTVTVSNITGNGSLGISLAAGTAADTAGNSAAAAGPGASFEVDNTAPTISISPPSSPSTVSGPISYTVDYSGASTITLAAGDISLNTTSTATGTVGVSGSGTDNRTVTISNISGSGTIGISIAAATASDPAGNSVAAAGPAGTFLVDNTLPVVSSIVPISQGPTKASSISFAITFSEAVVNFNDAADLVLLHSGSSHSGVSISGEGTDWAANVTGLSGDGSFTLAVNTASDVQDIEGNVLASSVTSAPVSIDNTPPGIAIGAPSQAATSLGPVTYTISYSGADTISLANGDVTLNISGSASGTVNVSGAGTASRTVTISNITGSGTLGISLAAGTASDSAGNDAPATGPSATFSVVVDEIIFGSSFE